MEGFIGKRGLIEPGRLRQLYRRSDAQGWLRMGAHSGLLALLGICSWVVWEFVNVWFAVIPLFAYGVVLNFFYAAQHELSHDTVFKTRWLNRAFGRAIGFIMLFPRDFDQIMHFAHHRNTQDWETDGELVGRPPFTLTSYLLELSSLSYWARRVKNILQHSWGEVPESYVCENEKRLVVREARRHLLGYIAIAVLSIATGSWAALFYWLLPMLATKPVHQLQNLSEHLGLTHAPNTLANTRTLETNALMRFLAWNMQYHTAHHTFPSVPFHALPTLHREIIARTGKRPNTMTYLDFQRKIIAALWGGRTEDCYPQQEAWILSDDDQAAGARRGLSHV